MPYTSVEITPTLTSLTFQPILHCHLQRFLGLAPSLLQGEKQACYLLFVPYPFYWASEAIVNADLKKSIKKVKYKATAYSKKILRRNDNGETYYLIKTENETKIVKASTLLVDKQDKFADSEHRAGTADIEYIEIELDKGLPEYKRELLNQRLTSNAEKKWKNQLNIVNYVSKEV